MQHSPATSPHDPSLFDWQPRTRLVAGPGTLSRVGGLAAELGGKRALVVTDSGIVAAGHAEKACAFLRAAGLSVAVDDGVRENPTTADVARCVAIARESGADIFIGIGGGSSMDTAKGANFIPDERRRDARLLGRWESHKADAPAHSHPDDIRHGQRVPERGFDCRRSDSSKDGVSRPEGCRTGGHS